MLHPLQLESMTDTEIVEHYMLDIGNARLAASLWYPILFARTADDESQDVTLPEARAEALGIDQGARCYRGPIAVERCKGRHILTVEFKRTILRQWSALGHDGIVNQHLCGMLLDEDRCIIVAGDQEQVWFRTEDDRLNPCPEIC